MGYIQNLNLSLLDGNKVLEVRDANINKGIIVKKWLNKKPWDFILCAGDDITDEDMFAVMPEETFSIKVGIGKSVAQHYVNSSAKIIDLLSELTEI
jgi:trehalose 6-phosphate synthase/phosphatase